MKGKDTRHRHNNRINRSVLTIVLSWILFLGMFAGSGIDASAVPIKRDVEAAIEATIDTTVEATTDATAEVTIEATTSADEAVQEPVQDTTEVVGETENVTDATAPAQEPNEAAEQATVDETAIDAEALAEETPAEPVESSFWVEFIDVGQGDCALIECDGHYMMIDGGPASASSIVYTILKDKGITNLDYMIATHPDADHIGGLSGALNYATVGVCYSSVTKYDSKGFNNLVKYLRKQDAKLTVPNAGDSFTLGSATVDIIGPVKAGTDTNNNSIVTKITYGSTSFLFMGDAEVEEEKSLVKAKVDLKCDVLKVGHHGSNSSTGKDLLKKANPKYAVICVGADNSYQHPTEATMKALKNKKVELYRTDMQGDVICTSDGTNLTFTTEKEASTEALWLASASSKATVKENGKLVVATDPQEVIDEIPQGTTFVLNKSTKRFHYATCASVAKMKDKNKEYSAKTAEELKKEGYGPCGNCKPADPVVEEPKQEEAPKPVETPKKEEKPKEEKKVAEPAPAPVVEPAPAPAPVVEEAPAPAQSSAQPYVLNTNSHKFHYPGCKSVKKMKDSNRCDVTSTREEIISQGYDPCKNCNP